MYERNGIVLKDCASMEVYYACQIAIVKVIVDSLSEIISKNKGEITSFIHRTTLRRWTKKSFSRQPRTPVTSYFISFRRKRCTIVG